MARVYNEGAIDSAYDFVLKIKSIFGKANIHSTDELKRLVVLMLFVDYVRREDLAHIDWIDWHKQSLYEDLDPLTAADLLTKQNLLSAIEQIEEQIPSLKGVFSDLRNLNADFIDEAVVKKIIKAFRGYPLESDNLGLCFTEVVYELYSDNTIKKTDPHHAQGHEISELMTRFIPYRESMRIYNPFSGLGEFLFGYKEDVSCVGDEHSQTIYSLSKLLLYINNANNSTAYHSDVFANDKDITNKFDAVICHPPFDLSSPKIIALCINALKDHGKAIILLPRDFLNSTNKEELAFRKHLVSNNLIEWVITLPSYRLKYTNLRTTIVVLRKAPQESKKISMIDLSVGNRLSDVFDYGSEIVMESLKTEIPWFNRADIDDIKTNQYNLVPNLYLLASKREKALEETGNKLVKLKDVLKPIKEDKSPKYKGKVAGRDSLSKDYAYAMKDQDTLTARNEWDLKPRHKLLTTNSLLIAKDGPNPKATYYIGDEKDIFYNSSEIYAFVIDTETIEVDFLLAELHKEDVKQQWDSFLTGTGLRRITENDLLQIEIIMPESRYQQKRAAEEYRRKLIEKRFGERDSVIEELKNKQHEDLSIKKHRIAPYLRNARSLVKNIITIMSKHDGVLKNTDIIDAEQNSTVESSLKRLQGNLKDIAEYIHEFTNEIMYYPSESLSINTLLSELADKANMSKPFAVYYKNRPIEADDIFIKFSRKNFEDVFNNIIENAERHGFVEDDKGKYRVNIVLNYDESAEKVRIVFENNGKAMPKGAKEGFRRRYDKAGLTGNTGIGGWEITETTEHFGGQVKVNEPEPKAGSEYPVRIELILDVINKDDE